MYSFDTIFFLYHAGTKPVNLLQSVLHIQSFCRYRLATQSTGIFNPDEVKCCVPQTHPIITSEVSESSPQPCYYCVFANSD